MNTMKRHLVGMLMFLGMSAMALPSHALLIEPILGYGATTMDVTTASVSGDDNPSNLYYGLRLGTDIVDLGFASLYTAIDYKTGSGEFKLGGLLGSSDFTHTLTSIDVGLDLPLIRAWMGYHLTNSIDYDETSLEDYDGSGAISIGVGLGFLPFVEINVEYLTSSDSEDGTKQELDFLMVGVSIPLDL